MGYVALKNASIKALEEKAAIHDGPNDTVYEGLPGVQYDATIELSDEKEKISIRGDVYIVTNEIDHMIQAIFSKEVEGEGMSSYIKQNDSELDIMNSSEVGIYNLSIKSGGLVEKPGYSPVGLFLKTVKNEFEKKIVENEQKIITNIANNL